MPMYCQHRIFSFMVVAAQGIGYRTRRVPDPVAVEVGLPRTSQLSGIVFFYNV